MDKLPTVQKKDAIRGSVGLTMLPMIGDGTI
jgi:hypothetical protein